MPATSHTSARDLLKRAAADRILVLDGAMCTMIQAMGLDEAGYRSALEYESWREGWDSFVARRSGGSCRRGGRA